MFPQCTSRLGPASVRGEDGGGEMGFWSLGVGETGGSSGTAGRWNPLFWFPQFPLRTELVYVLIHPDGHKVLPLYGEAVIMLVEVENVQGDVGGFPSYVKNGFLTYSWISFPQFTGRTPDMAPNRELAMVRLILLGYSGLRMRRMNSRTLR